MACGGVWRINGGKRRPGNVSILLILTLFGPPFRRIPRFSSQMGVPKVQKSAISDRGSPRSRVWRRMGIPNPVVSSEVPDLRIRTLQAPNLDPYFGSRLGAWRVQIRDLGPPRDRKRPEYETFEQIRGLRHFIGKCTQIDESAPFQDPLRALINLLFPGFFAIYSVRKD